MDYLVFEVMLFACWFNIITLQFLGIVISTNLFDIYTQTLTCTINGSWYQKDVQKAVPTIFYRLVAQVLSSFDMILFIIFLVKDVKNNIWMDYLVMDWLLRWMCGLKVGQRPTWDLQMWEEESYTSRKM